MVFKRKSDRKAHPVQDSLAQNRADVLIDLDAPAPPQRHEDGVDNPERRAFLGKALALTASAAASGLVGADVGARIRKANDRAVTEHAVNGLVAEARRETTRAEQTEAAIAMAQAQSLMMGLRRAKGQTVVSGNVLDGSITWQTKDGPMRLMYPIVFGDFEDPTVAEKPRWAATWAIDDGMTTFQMVPIGDGKITLNGRDALQSVGFYTLGHGGGDTYQATDLWMTADGQTAWRQPSEMIYPKP